jgi:hypothetical protein
MQAPTRIVQGQQSFALQGSDTTMSKDAELSEPKKLLKWFKQKKQEFTSCL